MVQPSGAGSGVGDGVGEERGVGEGEGVSVGVGVGDGVGVGVAHALAGKSHALSRDFSNVARMVAKLRGLVSAMIRKASSGVVTAKA